MHEQEGDAFRSRREMRNPGPWICSRGFRNNPRSLRRFDAPSTRISLDELRPRRAYPRFTECLYRTSPSVLVAIAFEHQSRCL